MGDLLSETTALWTIAVVLGYPILALGLVEAYRHARTGYPELARLINLLQVSVLPFVALHVLMKRVAEVPPDNTAAKLVLTALSISGINALLLGLNLLVRIGPAANEALARTPGLVLDLIRLVLVLVASAFVASTIWTVDLGSLMAALGVGSVVIGLALQDTMSGLFSGVSLMSGRHFREGDWIEYGSSSGKIVKLDWRSVTIETLDDERLIVIPNSALAQGGFTVLASSTRVFGQNIYVKFSYGTPPARAMDAIEYAVGSVDLILRDPAHDIDLMEFSDDGITFEVTIHTQTREEGEAATTDLLRRLWYKCLRENLQFAGAANSKYRDNGPPALHADQIRQILAATGVFLPEADGFANLLVAARTGLFDQGERLLQAGMPCRRLFLVVDGQLSVSHGDDKTRRSLQNFGAGEFFISRFLLTGAPSSVDLFADTETMTLSLETIDIIDFLNHNPALARQL